MAENAGKRSRSYRKTADPSTPMRSGRDDDLFLFFKFLFFEDQGHLDEVLADEPGLQLVRTEDVADDEVVGALVAGFCGRVGYIEAALDDDLVGFEEAGDLDGHLFPASRRALDAGGLGYVWGHGDGDAAEELDA